jgi:hypothetical protein
MHNMSSLFNPVPSMRQGDPKERTGSKEHEHIMVLPEGIFK